MRVKIAKKIQTNLMLITLLALMSACAQQEQPLDEELDDSLSGNWLFVSVQADPETNEFSTSHMHVKITEDEDTVVLDHCLHDKKMTFTRSDNVLTNNTGQSLEIVQNNRIDSRSVPRVSHLTRQEFTHDIHDAGRIVMESSVLPEIDVSQNVCAQRIIDDNDDSITLQLSIPFNDTYLDITFVVSDTYNITNNLELATLSSAELMTYYENDTMISNSGFVNFSQLSNNRATFEFEINLIQYSQFPLDQLTGSVDVEL